MQKECAHGMVKTKTVHQKKRKLEKFLLKNRVLMLEFIKNMYVFLDQDLLELERPHQMNSVG